MITGVYRGMIDDALRQARAASADIWVVEGGTNGPFAESSRLPQGRDWGLDGARVYGVERAGGVTYQTVQTYLNGKPLRLFVIGYELRRPGGPGQLVAGRDILRSHYVTVVDRSAGLALGQDVPLGTHGHKFTVVGLRGKALMSPIRVIRSSYMTLSWMPKSCNSHSLLLNSVAGKLAGGTPRETSNPINAVIAKVSPYVPITQIAASLARWKHFKAPTEAEQENLLSKEVDRKIAPAAVDGHDTSDHCICRHHRLDHLHPDLG